MKHILCIIAVCCAAALSGAEVLTGVVDLEKIFREYYKSKIAEELIQEQAKIYREYLDTLNRQMNEMQQNAQKLRINAQNLALSREARADSERQLEQLQRNLTAKKTELDMYIRGRTADMRKLESSKRAEIMADIQEQVSRSASIFGYGFVLDSSGQTSNGRSTLLLFPKGRDFTSHVITELNRTRSKNAPVKSGVKKE